MEGQTIQQGLLLPARRLDVSFPGKSMHRSATSPIGPVNEDCKQLIIFWELRTRLDQTMFLNTTEYWHVAAIPALAVVKQITEDTNCAELSLVSDLQSTDGKSCSTVTEPPWRHLRGPSETAIGWERARRFAVSGAIRIFSVWEM